MANWHGWRAGNVQLSIAPHPQNARAIAMLLTIGEQHSVVGEFYSEAAAEDTMAFLDSSFEVSALANAQLVERLTDG